MRTPKPWRRGDRGWYVQVGKRQVALGHDEKEAWAKYHRLMATEGLAEPAKDIGLIELADLFLDEIKRRNKPTTYELRLWFLKNLTKAIGQRKASEIRPRDILNWADGNLKWEGTTRQHAVRVAKQVFRWGKKEGLIAANPLDDFVNPYQAKNREKLVSDTEFDTIVKEVKDRQFRDYLTALRLTGARPGEIAKVEAKDCKLEQSVVVLNHHKTERHGKPRVIVLPTKALELFRELIAKHPTGPLFPNSEGGTWNKSNVYARMKRLRDKLNLDGSIVVYSLRHSYATTALEKGVDSLTVAKLLGHSSVKQLERYYAHLQLDHLRDAAEKAVTPSA